MNFIRISVVRHGPRRGCGRGSLRWPLHGRQPSPTLPDDPCCPLITEAFNLTINMFDFCVGQNICYIRSPQHGRFRRARVCFLTHLEVTTWLHEFLNFYRGCVNFSPDEVRFRVRSFSIFYFLRGYLALLLLMACCILCHTFQDGQCLLSFCAPSLGVLQEVLRRDLQDDSDLQWHVLSPLELRLIL